LNDLPNLISSNRAQKEGCDKLFVSHPKSGFSHACSAGKTTATTPVVSHVPPTAWTRSRRTMKPKCGATATTSAEKQILREFDLERWLW